MFIYLLDWLIYLMQEVARHKAGLKEIVINNYYI